MDVQDSNEIPAKAYHSNIVHGGSAHFGDTYHVNYGISPQEQMYERFLDSLRYREMFLRENQIADSFPSTFDWIFNDYLPESPHPGFSESQNQQNNRQSFGEWLRNSNHPFWIYGKPGAGKSTLMKHLARHHKTIELLEDTAGGTEATVLKFYFWLPGDENQRSLKGCLTSLLFQAANAHRDIVLRHLNSDLGLRRKRFCEDWSVSEQKALLMSILQSTQPCCIFLDGVDEFDRDGDLDDLITWSQNLIDNGIKVCISSRPEPQIAILVSSFSKLCLQDLTMTDIEILVQERLEKALNGARMSKADGFETDRLIGQIVHKSDGVFLWACLAVQSLIHGIKNGDSIGLLEQRLTILPTRLEDLYTQMWDRIRQEDKQLYRDEACLFLALTRYRPISLLMFTLAVEQGLARQLIQSRKFTAELISEIFQSCLAMANKLWTRTGGLLECVQKNSGDIDSFDLHKFINHSIDTDSPLYKYFQPIVSRNDLRLDVPTTNISAHSAKNLTSKMEPDVALCNCIWFGIGCPLDSEAHQPFQRDAKIALKYVHNSRIAFVHRSAVEFVQTLGIFTNSDASDRLLFDIDDRFARSLAALRILGCGWEDLWGHGQQNYPDNLLPKSSFVNIAFTIEKELQLSDDDQLCTYGWYHSIYLHEILFGDAKPDFLGELASIRDCDLVKLFISRLPCSKLSSYYTGYLLICAATALNYSASLQSILRLCSLIVWLLEQDIDMRTQHAKTILKSYVIKFTIPYEECWLGLMRVAQIIRFEYSTEQDGLMPALCKVLDRLSKYSQNTPSVVTFVSSNGERAITDLFELGNGLIGALYLVSVDIAELESNLRACNDPKNAELPKVRKKILRKYPSRGQRTQSLLSIILENNGFGFGIPPGDSAVELHDPVSTPRLVAPDMTKEIDPDKWYEQCELREWHERRRRGLIRVPKHIEDFEDKYGLTPSYRRKAETTSPTTTAPSRKRKRDVFEEPSPKTSE